MSAEISRQRVYVVNRENPAAWSAVVKIAARHNMKPGSVIPLTQDEFDALKDDIVCLELPRDMS